LIAEERPLRLRLLDVPLQEGEVIHVPHFQLSIKGFW
jgi:hypothetical protein